MSKILTLLTESRKFLTTIVWVVVLIIVLSALGRWLIHRGDSGSPKRATTQPVPQPAVDWSGVDAAIVDAMKLARAKAEDEANAKLDAWTVSLMGRVDSDFLDWYFGYWNQQVLGLKGMWYWTLNKIFDDEPEVAERITQDIQEEFSKRVLRPQIAQMEIERITREVIETYIGELGTNLGNIPKRFNLPQPAWERHLEDLALISSGTEGNRGVPLTMKTVAVGSAAAATVAVKAFAPMIGKVTAKISAKLAGKATAKLAAKTGAKVAAKSAGKFAGPIIGVGVILWDVWDHNHTKGIERPILRQSLADYFSEMKQSFMHDPESGIATIIRGMEGQVVKDLGK